MKKLLVLLLAVAMLFTFAACANDTETPPAEDESANTETDANAEDTHEPVTIMIAAAASLENVLADELIPLFQSENDWVTVEGTYDSSGKLQTQIEEGLAADIFFSAATKQMNALNEAGLITPDSIVELLENKIVLIEPASAPSGITSFEAAAEFDGVIALGDPESVPAGQYAQEAFTSLGIWDQVAAKASLGTNVTEVLNWVAEGSAGLGVVYATDAASKADGVTVIAEAPAGSLAQPVIYPVGMLSRTENQEAAQLFIDFLQSDQAAAIFEAYGFTMAE